MISASEEETLLVTLVSVGPLQSCVKKARRAPKRVDSFHDVLPPRANSPAGSPSSSASVIKAQRRMSEVSFFDEGNYAIKAIRADPKVLLNDNTSLNLFTTEMFEECDRLLPALNNLFEAHGQHQKLLAWAIAREMALGGIY